MYTDERDKLTNLVQKFLDQPQGTVWIGAGLSISGGYPSWDELVRELCAECGLVSALGSEFEGESLQDEVDRCKHSSPGKYYEYLQRTFGRPITGTHNCYRQLVDLKFHTYITTNFDPLLANAVVGSDDCKVFFYPELDSSGLGSRGSIYYIHGLARKGTCASVEQLVLSKKEFDDAYRSPLLTGLLTNLFTFRPILFLGYGLREPQIYTILAYSHKLQSELLSAKSHVSAPQKTILMDRPEIIDRREYSDLPRDPMSDFEHRCAQVGINVVWYDKGDRFHSVIAGAIEELCRRRNLSVAPKYGSPFEEDLK